MKESMEELREYRCPIVLHHWDADGICSAAMLKRFAGGHVRTMTPRIGMYSLSEDDYSRIRVTGSDAVIVVDLALPEEDFDLLARRFGNVWVFDHHVKERRDDLHQFNPVAHGALPDRYPSTTYVISEVLDEPLDLPTVLGIVGDREENILDLPSYPAVKEYIESKGIELHHLLEAVELLDSNYRVGDVKAVDSAVDYVLEHGDDIISLLDNKHWIASAKKVRKQIEEVESNSPTPTDGILVHRFSSNFDIISALSRRLSKRDDVRTCLVVQMDFFEEYDRVYVRTNNADSDLRPVLDMAKGKGFIAGGKREVVGAVIPKEDTESFQEDVLNLMEAD